MIENVPFAEATVEKLADVDVVLAVGFGDPHAPRVLLGRKTFASAAANRAIAAETNIWRVKISSQEELDELTGRVKEAKGELDPGVEEPK